MTETINSIMNRYGTTCQVPYKITFEVINRSTITEVINYPNPFSDRTAMQYKLTRSGFVSVRVCDLFGRTVKILLAEVQPSGIHTLSWNARDGAGNRVASGSYFLIAQSGRQSIARRLEIKR